MVTVEVKSEPRKGTEYEPFGSLIVNDTHIWRFETVNQAELVKQNLVKALQT